MIKVLIKIDGSDESRLLAISEQDWGNKAYLHSRTFLDDIGKSIDSLVPCPTCGRRN